MRSKNFTLIELIVVIAIIAVLAAIIAPNAFRAIEKAKVSRAISDYKSIKTASNALYADTGQWPGWHNCDYPISDSDLLQNVRGLFGWDGPYLEKVPNTHPWGGLYYFEGENDYAKSPTQPADGRTELIIDFENACYPFNPSTSSNCSVPDSAAKKIDETVDDGDNSWGNFRHSTADDTHWILAWGDTF
jgi:type II secretion system protein G